MTSKDVILITGANTGLGLEVVRALCKSSNAFEIIVGSRSAEKGEVAVATVKKELPDTASTLSVVQIDVESDESIEKAVETVSSKHNKVDVLINNAGQNFDHDMQKGKYGLREGFNKSWDVNVSGAHVMTTLFMPLLFKASDPRLMFVTSGTSSLIETERFDGPMYSRLNGAPEKGWPKEKVMNPVTSYRSTKTGLNMLTREWARILRNDGVKVWAISPGFLATGLAGVGPEVLKKVSEAARFFLFDLK